MNQIALRVTLGGSGLVKTLRFNPDMSIEEVGASIIEKTGEGDESYGLYLEGKLGVRKAKWLKKDKTLQSYDLKNGEEVSWKSRNRPIKVKLMDGTVKTVMIDESSSVEYLIELIGGKIGLEKTEEYGLQIEGSDATKWLNNTQSLQDQGVTEHTILKFKKRFFVDDLNVDKSDPIQLHLVYLQSRDAILSGEYPVQLEEACQFASVQLQVEVGNYDPQQHNDKWFRRQEFLPAAHIKKAQFKDIARLWEKCANMNKINAYYKYVQTCRQLPTYGITTFEVREKQEDKKKLVTVLLGVTRDSVMRMDAVTKEVIKAYPLEHVRRWAAAKTTFTLDFGTYEKDYYTVETSRGEEISQLLSGYIDILLKRRGDGILTLADADADIAETEELGPLMAVPNVSTVSQVGVGKYSADDFREQELMPGRMVAERGNVVDKEQKIQVDFAPSVNAARRLLGEFDNQALISAGSAMADPSRLRDDLLAAASKLGKAVSDMLGGLDGPADQVNINAEAAANRLKALVDAAKLAAANTNDQALLDAGKRVAEAVARMLEASRDVSMDPNSLEAKRALQEAISALKGASGYLQGAVNGLLTDPASEQLLLESAKQVADAVKRLAGNANRYAGDLDEDARKDIATLAKRAAGAGQNVQDTARMLAPLIVDPTAKQQLLSAGKMASSDCELLLKAASAKLPASEMQRLADAARAVNEALAQMLSAADTASSRAAQNQEAMSSAAARIIAGLNEIKTSAGKAREMDHGVRTVLGAVPNLLQAAKRAAVVDPSVAPAMIQSSKEVAGASRQFQGAAKSALADPKDMERFKRLLYASQALANATKNLLGDGQKYAVFSAVRSAAKEAASTVTAFANTGRRGIRDVEDEAAQKRLLEAADSSSAAVQELVEALKVAALDPENINAQARLVAAAKKTSKPMAAAVNSGRQVVPDVSSVATKQALLFTTKEAGKAISALVDACNKAGAVTGEQDIDEAFEVLNQTTVELDSRVLDANVGALKVVGTRDANMAKLQAELQPLIAATKELAEAQQIGKEAKRAATATKSVAEAAVAVAASVSGKDNQVQVLVATKEIVPAVKELIEASRQASTVSDKTVRSNADLREAQENLQQRLRDMLTATQKGTGAEECIAAADSAQAALNKLVLAPSYKPGDIVALSAEVEQRAASLEKAVAELERVVSDRKQDAEVLKGAATAVSSEVPLLVASVNQITASSKNPEAQDAIVRATQVMGGHAAEALRAAATARIDATARSKVSEEVASTSAGKQQLEVALAAATPGIAELEKALRMIDDALAMSDDLPAGEYNLQSLHASTNQLGDSAVHVIQAARLKPEDLGKSSVEAARALAAVINGARGFSPAAQAISTAQSVEKRVQAMGTDAKAAQDGARYITQAVPRALKAIRDASEKETPDVKARMDKAAAAVGPALAALAEEMNQFNTHKDPKRVKAAAERVAKELSNVANMSSDKAKMQELLNAAKTLGTVTRTMVTDATKVARNPGDTAAIDSVTKDGTHLGTAMKEFKELTKSLSPGHLDATKAAADAMESVANLDKNAMAATVGLLDVVTDKSHQTAKEEQKRTLEALDKAAVELVNDVNKEDYAALGLHSVAAAKCLDDMCQSAINVAASTSNQETQTDHLNQAKDVADRALACLQINTALTEDSSSNMLKMDLKKAASDLHDQIRAMLESMKGGLAGLQACDEAVETIRAAKASLDNVSKSSSSGSGYAQLQSALIKKAGECAVSGTQLFQTAKSNPESVGDPSKALAKEVRDMVEAARDAAATSSEAAIRESLVAAAKQVADSAVSLILSSKKVAGDSQNQLLIDELSRGFQDLTSRVTGLIRAVKEGATGERDANEAVNLIRRVVADLDQCAVYASTGDYETKGNATLDKCYEEEIEATREVAAAAGQLVSAVAESQTTLGTASKNFASSIARFGDSTKSLAGATGDVVTQSELFGNSKSLGTASQQLVIAAQRAQAARDDPAARQLLQEKAAKVKASLQELVGGVNQTLGPAVRGVKDLTSAQVQIVEATKAFGDPNDLGNEQATPNDIAVQLRKIKKAQESLMTVTGTSDKSTSTSAQELGDATAAMLRAVKGNFRLISSQKANVRADVAASAVETAKKVLAYLELSKTQRRDKEEVVTQIQDSSASITELSQKTIEAARGIPGGEDLELEENKLEDKASQQLVAAAEQIKAAAAMLMNAPRKVKDPSAELDEEDIAADLLDRCREITSATYDLLIASIDAQREIQSMGKASSTANAYRSDPQWAQGLISAAKAVAQTSMDLVHAANGTVKKEFGQEAIVATSRMVTGATARLVAASKAKLPLTSANNDKLSVCAGAVNQSTKNLGTAAKAALEFEVGRDEMLNQMSEMNRIQLMKLEREEAEKINKAERDLESAHRKLKALRTQMYEGSGAPQQKIATGVGRAAGQPGAGGAAAGRGGPGPAGPGAGRAAPGPNPPEGGRGVPRKAAVGGRGTGPAGPGGLAPAGPGGRGRGGPGPLKSPRPGGDDVSPRPGGDAVSPRPGGESVSPRPGGRGN